MISHPETIQTAVVKEGEKATKERLVTKEG